MEQLKQFGSLSKDKIKAHQEIIFYGVMSISILLCFILGTVLAVNANKNTHDFPYSGVILNTDCKYEWNKNKGYY